MKLEDFLAHVNSGKRIVDNSEELEYCSYLTQEAWKVTMELNNAYHRPEEVQDLFAKLTGSEVNRSLALLPPFYNWLHHPGPGRRLYWRQDFDRSPCYYNRDFEPRARSGQKRGAAASSGSYRQKSLAGRERNCFARRHDWWWSYYRGWRGSNKGCTSQNNRGRRASPRGERNNWIEEGSIPMKGGCCFL